MTDYELVNSFASNTNVAQHGKFTKESLCRAFTTNFSDIGALARQGLVDVDISQTNLHSFETYYSFNSRWRQLIAKGSIESLIDWEREEAQKDRLKIEFEREFIKKQNDFIERQKELIESQKEANSNVISTNKRVVVILIITVLIAIIALIPPAYTIKRDNDKERAKDTIEQRSNTIKSLELKLQKTEKKLDSVYRILEHPKS